MKIKTSLLILLTTSLSAAAAENFASEEVFKRLTEPAAAAVPVVKNLDRAWVAKLADRGEPKIYTRENSNNFAYLGMPVGGIGAGQLYLSGDGRLWWWDIFNTMIPDTVFSMEQGEVFRKPPVPDGGEQRNLFRPAPVRQEFSLSAADADGQRVAERPLTAAGFADVRFSGQYPVGTVDYADAQLPLTVRLTAFSPFIPTNLADSSLPVTILRYAVTNTSLRPLTVTVRGTLENAVLRSAKELPPELLENLSVSGGAAKMLLCRAEPKLLGKISDRRKDVVIEDWSGARYRKWTVSGEAFGSGPIDKKKLPLYLSNVVGGDTPRVVNSHGQAPMSYDKMRDFAAGELRSKPFTLARDYVALWVGGSNDERHTFVSLSVDGQIVRQDSGRGAWMRRVVWDVREWRGKKAVIEIVDRARNNWGNVGAGRIWLTDTPAVPLNQAPDCGSLALAALGDPLSASVEAPPPVTGKNPPAGAVARTLTLSPGETKNFDFALAWHFPNLHSNFTVPGVPWKYRTYGTRFADAAAVANYVAENFSSLTAATLAWRDTWQDSTLPLWFLDRTMASASNLAASVTFLLGQEGVYYANEGVYSCPGTCTHVYQYAQAAGRLFPQLERQRRELVDLGVAFAEPWATMLTRGETGGGMAVDGQAGTLLRIYREHLLSPDRTFLTRNWEKIRRAYDQLFALDANEDGILEGEQHNTLDEAWYGKIAWLSGLYNAALLAGEQMALTVGDREFAEKCARIAADGQRNLTSELFNGEYFINKIAPAFADRTNSGTGCEIDQAYGQAWAWQVGLRRVLPAAETRSALRAVFRNNFTTDIAPYRARHPKGRVFINSGEGGVLMGTFPDPAWQFAQAAGAGKGYAEYLNEVWTGNEHALAAHLLWEGLAPEALAVERTIHERYDGAKRNPWSEVECGAHYGRAMAAYGVFVAACGFYVDGPAGKMEFAPRLSAEDFRAVFTAPAGWGSYWQKISAAAGEMTAGLELKYGTLALSELTVTCPLAVSEVSAELNGRPLAVSFSGSEGGRVTVKFPPLTLSAGGKLTLRLAGKK